MRNTMLVLMGLCLASIQGLEAQEKVAAFPDSALMKKYPIIIDTTGHVAKMAEMGLRRCTLKTDWTGYNWYERWHGYILKRFVYETLSTGTEAWCDSDGAPRYKADCVNLLTTKEECPHCQVSVPDSTRLALADSARVNWGEFLAQRASSRDTVVENRIYLPVQDGPGWFSRNWKWVTAGGLIVGGLCAWQCRLNVYQGPPR